MGRGEVFRRTSAILRACGQIDISKSTYYNYAASYRQNDGRRARIASTLRRSTFREDGLTKAQIHFADTVIMKLYVRDTRPRVSKVWRDAEDILKHTGNRWIDPTRCPEHPPRDLVGELLNSSLSMEVVLSNQEKARLLTSIAMPSKSWFYNRVRWFESQPDRGKMIVDRRHGKGTWDGEFRAFDTFATRATFPLEYVFADHLLLKVIILDAETRSRPDRLWLTALIDAFSRSVLGIALLYETPCIESIQSALQHAIWPKHSESEPELEMKWPCFGIPQQLSLDNAWAHHSHSLEHLSRAISHNGRYSSIDLDFRPPYRANRGALIERFFGNVSAQIRDLLLPGAILSRKRGEVKNALARACLLYEDLDRIITQIVLTYQNTVHRELHGRTPNERWLEGVQETGPQLVPPLTDKAMRMFWRRSPRHA